MATCAAMRQWRPIRASLAIVTSVADLGPLADDRVAVAAAIDDRIGTDLDIVLEDDAADLRDLQMGPVVRRREGKTFAADPRTAADRDPVAEQRHDDRREWPDRRAPPDPHVRPDYAVGADDRPAADLGPRADHGAGVDDDVGFEARIGMDRHARADPSAGEDRHGTQRFGKEPGGRQGEIAVRRRRQQGRPCPTARHLRESGSTKQAAARVYGRAARSAAEAANVSAPKPASSSAAMLWM